MPDESRPSALPPGERADASLPSSGRLERAAVLLVLGVVLCLAVVVPLVATLHGGAAASTRISRGYPGAFTGAATAVFRSFADLASAVTVGALVWLLLLGHTEFHKSGSARVLAVGDWFTIKLLRLAAAVWTVAGCGSIVFEAADSNGLAITEFVNPQALRFALTSGDGARAWMVSTAAAFLIWLVANVAASFTSYLVALWAGVVGSLAPVVVGQVLVGPDHDFGGDAAVVQTIATQTLLGVILVVALRRVSGRGVMPMGAQSRMLRRSAWLGLAVIVCTEIIITWFKLAGSPITGSATGRFALARFLALAVLAMALVIAHRADRGGPAGPVVALLAAGAGAFVVCGVAMTRISPPQFFVPTSISQILLGFDVDAAPSFAVLTTHWRPNLLFCTLAGTALLTYAAGLRRLRRRGEQWPVLRTIAWMSGWLVVVVATSSGFGKYSGPDFAVHMGVHMTLNMMAPVLIVLGGPISLALRSLPVAQSTPDGHEGPGLREKVVSLLGSPLLRLLYHPLLVFGIYIGSYYGLYLTGVFGTVMRFHWAHQLMNLHFLVAGCLYFGLVIGVDPTPRKLPHIAKLGFLMAAMPFHAFFGVILMSSSTVVAETFYRNLDLPWADLANTQKIAGGVAWAGGEIPLLAVAMVLALQWATQDTREARRIDRHLDTGLDDAHDAYNAMLRRLARHHHPDGAGERADADHRETTQRPIQDSSQSSRVQP